MKIAIIQQPIDTISSSVQSGSIEIWIYEVARRLARSCDVVVYAKRGWHQKKNEFDKGVHYKRVSTIIDELIAYILRGIDKLLTHSKFSLFTSPFFYFIYGLQVSKNLRVEKCDIVHIHNFSQLVPIIRAFNPKIKIVLHMHCEWLTQLNRVMIERRLREVNLIIGCCQYITKKIRRRFPQFSKRCHTIYNGVNVHQFVSANKKRVNKKKDIKRLLFIGRVSPEKGLHILLDAFKEVVDRYPQVQLYIVGSQRSLPLKWIIALSENPKVSDLRSFYHGSYISHLKNHLSSDLKNKVFFIGPVPHTQVIKYYQDADVFVNSSFSEAFPLPILEAMASELPVVATHVGGMPEAVENGKTGLLAEPGDSTALAEAILLLLHHEDLRKSIKKVARERAVELFSWEQIVKTLLYHYKKICDSNE